MKEKILKLNDIKSTNLQAVLEILLLSEGLSRVELARKMGCDNTTVTVYRYKEVIDWEYTTTNVNSAPGSDWVKEKNPTTEGDVTTYYWKKPVWSGWSEWSTEKVKPSSERQVETDEQYLY